MTGLSYRVVTEWGEIIETTDYQKALKASEGAISFEEVFTELPDDLNDKRGLNKSSEEPTPVKKYCSPEEMEKLRARNVKLIADYHAWKDKVDRIIHNRNLNMYDADKSLPTFTEAPWEHDEIIDNKSYKKDMR